MEPTQIAPESLPVSKFTARVVGVSQFDQEHGIHSYAHFSANRRSLMEWAGAQGPGFIVEIRDYVNKKMCHYLCKEYASWSAEPYVKDPWHYGPETWFEARQATLADAFGGEVLFQTFDTGRGAGMLVSLLGRPDAGDQVRIGPLGPREAKLGERTKAYMVPSLIEDIHRFPGRTFK